MSLLRPNKTSNRSDHIRDELSEGFEHLKSATTHAAEGAAEKMGPHVDRALTAVGLRKRPRRRWPWIAASAIAVTAAASAAAVLLLRRNAKMHEEESLEEDTRPEDRTYEEMIEESEPVGNAPYTSRSDNTKERAMTGA